MVSCDPIHSQAPPSVEGQDQREERTSDTPKGAAWMPDAENGNTEAFQPRPRRFKITDCRHVYIGRGVLVNCDTRVRRVIVCHVRNCLFDPLQEFRLAALSCALIWNCSAAMHNVVR